MHLCVAPSFAPSCTPCVEGRLCATPHSSSLCPATTSFQTLHLDVWGPARRLGPKQERYFLVVVDNYSMYTTVFLLAKKSEGITQSWTLPESPQQNEVAEHHIGSVMEIARTSMIHARAPNFLWPYAVRYTAHQLNLWPRVSRPGDSPTSLWTGSRLAPSPGTSAGCVDTRGARSGGDHYGVARSGRAGAGGAGTGGAGAGGAGGGGAGAGDTGAGGAGTVGAISGDAGARFPDLGGCGSGSAGSGGASSKGLELEALLL
ncbi:unnamed protein product, partial [Closterium sp. NIES-53]